MTSRSGNPIGGFVTPKNSFSSGNIEWEDPNYSPVSAQSPFLDAGGTVRFMLICEAFIGFSAPSGNRGTYKKGLSPVAESLRADN